MIEQYLDELLKEEATVWKPQGEDMYGRPGWEAPEVVAVRWEDKEETYLNEKGEEVGARSIVYSRSQIPVGSRISYGREDQPEPPSDSFKVVRVERIPSLEGECEIYRLLLA